MLDNIKRVSACEGKISYASRETADRICAKMRKKSKMSLEVYRCKHCGNLHIGRAG
jgi:hypothetical protein